MSLVLVPTAARAPARASAGPRVACRSSASGPAGAEWLTPEAQRRAGGGRRARRLRPVPRARAAARRAASPRERQPRRDRSRSPCAGARSRRSATSRSSPPATPGSSRWRRRCSRPSRRATAQFAGVEVRVVPGLSAMQAAAARVGRAAGPRLRGASRCRTSASRGRSSSAGSTLPAAADLALALYNPASRTRREQLERAREVLLRHRAPDARSSSPAPSAAPSEDVAVTTLGDFDADARRHAHAARSSARRRRA